MQRTMQTDRIRQEMDTERDGRSGRAVDETRGEQEKRGAAGGRRWVRELVVSSGPADDHHGPLH